MAEFDTVTKHLIHTWPRDFARFALRHDDLEVLDVLDTEQPTVEARRADSLIRVRIDGEEALVHYEFQTADSVPLMRRPSGLAPEAWLRRCVQRAQAAPLAEARKLDYLAELAILSGLVYTPESIMTVISEETMYESSIVQYFTEKGIKQGMEQGIEQGMERGIEQGGRQRAVEDLLDVLEIRFGLLASDPLAARLRAIGDVQRLTQLHRAAIQASDLDAFRGLVGE